MYLFSLKIVNKLIEHFLFELDKPTVKLEMSTRQRLMCVICAHPSPYRINWWWNMKERRDDYIHQTRINQSCIIQQFSFEPV